MNNETDHFFVRIIVGIARGGLLLQFMPLEGRIDCPRNTKIDPVFASLEYWGIRSLGVRFVEACANHVYIRACGYDFDPVFVENLALFNTQGKVVRKRTPFGA
jgi:hypothetical protein